MASNGRLSRSALGPITKAVNGQQAYLRKDAAKAFMAMNAESERRYSVTLRVSSARVAYRTYAEQVYFWNLYTSGRGALAARPGTSNHGWGLAVDLASTRMRQIVDAIGAKYGWAKKWSDAPSEWWHIMWRAGNYSAVNNHKSDPTIRRGGKNSRAAVKRLKALLRDAGVKRASGHHKFPRMTKTGGFGSAPDKRVRWFQAHQHLTVDGIVGTHTWTALRKAARR